MGLLSRLRGASASVVVMKCSVAGGGLDLLGGVKYRVPVDVADRLIARGYAEGELSRPFSDEELNGLRGNPQVVKLG